MRLPRPGEIRVAAWSLYAAAATWPQLRRRALPDVVVPGAPRVGVEAGWVAGWLLTRTRRTCLLSSVVRQRFYADNGEPNDVVIGVRSAQDDDTAQHGVASHAWLLPRDAHVTGWTEISRRSPDGRMTRPAAS